LGNAEKSLLSLREPISDNENVDFSLIDGNVTLLGVCIEGGARLINRNAQAGIVRASTHLPGNTIGVEVSFTEIGYSELNIYNMVGEKVKTLFGEEIVAPHTREVLSNINGLGSGQYIILFKTPTFMESQKVLIVR
jgi:hypothetical protein